MIFLRRLWVLYPFFLSVELMGQTTISGKLVDKVSDRSIIRVEVFIEGKKLTVTDKYGDFQITLEETKKTILLQFFKIGYIPLQQLIDLNGKYLNLGTIKLTNDPVFLSQDISVVSDLDIESQDGELNQTSIGILSASKDPFKNIVSFQFSNVFFRLRGLDGKYSDVYINGMRVNKLTTGRVSWNNWGGLNSVTNNKIQTNVEIPHEYGLGSITDAVIISMKPSEYRQGLHLTASLANQNSYKNRFMATYSSGMSKNDWAFSLSSSLRYAKEGYIEGTNYKAISGYMGIEKKFKNHQIILTSIAAFNKHAGNSSGTSETYGKPDLYYLRFNGEVPDIPKLQKNHFYNSYWGWQNGKKRNARVRKIFEPFAILSHNWTLNQKTKLFTSLFYQQGINARTRIERYNRESPYPDYYRKLPSYHISLGNVEEANRRANLFNTDVNYSQINWARLYKANQTIETIDKESGTKNPLTGKRSYYYLAEDHYDDATLRFSSTFFSQISKTTHMILGISLAQLKSENYREIKDLLGGDFYLDKNSFALANRSQDNDLLNPDHAAVRGDRVAYNYDIHLKSGEFFFNQQVNLGMVEYYLAGDFQYREFWRDGKFKNGSYPSNSLGKSKKATFLGYGLNTGIKLNLGKNFFNLSGAFIKHPPSYLNVFISPRSNNSLIPKLEQEEINSASLTYNRRSSKIKGRASLFYTKIQNETDVNRFFIQGNFNDSFINEIVTGIDKQHIGIEIGLEYQLTETIKVISALSFGNFTFSSRPNISAINENSGEEIIKDEVAYVKNFKISRTPHRAYSLGFEYRSPNYWWVGINGNYFDHTYLDFIFSNRTSSVYINPDRNVPFENITDNIRSLLKQRQLPSAFFLNMNIGKSWKIHRKYYINIILSVRNILDNKDYIIGGYEQARYGNIDFIRNNYAITPKFYYATGRTFFLNLIFSL